MTDLYLRLSYKEYKNLEDQLRDWDRIETSHTSVDGYYHKALRLDIGDLCLEVQGPAVKAPVRENGSNVSDSLISAGKKFALTPEDLAGLPSGARAAILTASDFLAADDPAGCDV